METASSINFEASLEILNSGSVFLKYLNTADDFEDHNVILGFLATISLTSATFSIILISSEENPENFENLDTGALFNLQKYEYVDQSSVMFPHKSQQVLHNTESDYFELTE